MHAGCSARYKATDNAGDGRRGRTDKRREGRIDRQTESQAGGGRQVTRTVRARARRAEPRAGANVPRSGRYELAGRRVGGSYTRLTFRAKAGLGLTASLPVVLPVARAFLGGEEAAGAAAGVEGREPARAGWEVPARAPVPACWRARACTGGRMPGGKSGFQPLFLGLRLKTPQGDCSSSARGCLRFLALAAPNAACASNAAAVLHTSAAERAFDCTRYDPGAGLLDTGGAGTACLAAANSLAGPKPIPRPAPAAGPEPRLAAPTPRPAPFSSGRGDQPTAGESSMVPVGDGSGRCPLIGDGFGFGCRCMRSTGIGIMPTPAASSGKSPNRCGVISPCDQRAHS